MINQNPDYFEAMESQYLVQNEIELEQKKLYFIAQGLCPYCEGSGLEVSTNDSSTKPCSYYDYSNGELSAK